MPENAIIRVLLVEEDDSDAERIRTLLENASSHQFEIVTVGLIKLALDLLSQHRFDVLLLGLTLPDGRGLSNLNQVQAMAPNVPIIAMSNVNDERLALQAVKAGAQDYLVKSRTDHDTLLRALRYSIERKHAEERMAYLAHYDVLTDLPNRALFRDRMTRAFAHAQRHGRNIALMFLDLDHFKSINDTLGHDAGDQLLVAAASRLEACVRRIDTIARLGGDEFTIVVEEISTENDVTVIAQKIIDAMARSFVLNGDEVFVTVSIGIAMFPNHGLDPVTLIKNADTALYSAKAHGRGCFHFYNPHMHFLATERLALVTALRHAVRRSEFELHYQPLLETHTQRLHGVEALLRWNHPTLGQLAPERFVSLLEDTGLILDVGTWVIRAACQQIMKFGDASPTVSVNVSMRQFHQPDFVGTVATIIRDTGIDTARLQFEVTESVLTDNVAATTAKLRALHALGIRIAIDDFGTGYCSLSYLKQFPLHAIKMDRSFIRDIATGNNDAAIATAIIALGHSLNMEVVAEGVETEAQLAYLRDRGCDFVQGFLYGQPMSASALTAWLYERGTMGRALKLSAS